MKNILIINCAEPTVREFVDPLIAIAKNAFVPFQQREYRDLPTLKTDDYSGIILSGSPCGDDIVDHHRPFFRFLEIWEKPLLGICAGHHLVGAHFGATLIREQEKELGKVMVSINISSPIFDGLPMKFEAEAMHHDSITAPEGFAIIASTEKCLNTAMQRQGYNWFTFQFHPEIQNQTIIENFLRIVTFAA